MALVPVKYLEKIEHLIRSATRVTGLHICFHDRTRRVALPANLRLHEHPACAIIKRDHGAECARFDGTEVYTALAGKPEGRIHQCPKGLTEIAVPVNYEGLHGGVLFAGACWLGEGEPPYPGLVLRPSRDWLEDRLAVMQALARELGELLRGEPSYIPEDRKKAISRFVTMRIESAVTISDLAGELSLSASRTGHIVQELFDMTFPQLVSRIKMKEAAKLLVSTQLTIGQLATMVGYDDQNYFSRIFSKQYRMSPRAYRKTYYSQTEA